MERERRSPYKEFKPGDTLDFNLQTLFPDGSSRLVSKTVVIEAIKGGGFFGKVLIPKDEPFVIKTSLPDPWHHFWRTVNWDFNEFPTQVSETHAQLEHVATRIINNVLPVLSEGKFYSPDSLGCALLPTGWAQVVEKIDARPPRFDTGSQEYRSFREAQRELTELCFRLGLEQVGQVHPDNPFGMANIWFDSQKGEFVWLDTLPAIPHRGFVYPFFRFKFHEDIRNRLGTSDLTFNRIHTARLASEVLMNKHLFNPEALDDIRKDIRLYANLRRTAEKTNGNKEDAKQALAQLAKDLFTERFVYKFLTNPNFREEKIKELERLLKDPDYRIFFVNKMLMSGVETAKSQGVLKDDELKRAWEEIEKGEGNPERKRALVGLQLYYFVANRMVDVIAGSAILSSILANNLEAAAAIQALVIEILLPPFLRAGGTVIVGKARGLDLKVAQAITSLPLIPFIPSYGAIPAQIAVFSYSEGSDLVWHYRIREFIANLSKLSPTGGWGSQLEAELWSKIGRRLEKLGKNSKNGR